MGLTFLTNLKCIPSISVKSVEFLDIIADEFSKLILLKHCNIRPPPKKKSARRLKTFSPTYEEKSFLRCYIVLIYNPKLTIGCIVALQT